MAQFLLQSRVQPPARLVDSRQQHAISATRGIWVQAEGYARLTWQQAPTMKFLLDPYIDQQPKHT